MVRRLTRVPMRDSEMETGDAFINGGELTDDQIIKENEMNLNKDQIQVESNPKLIINQSEVKQNSLQSQVLPNRNKTRFEDAHNRVTTYISKENHEQLKRLREIKGIPMSETLNRALSELFRK